MHAVILSSTTFSPTFDINSLKQVYFVSQMDNVHNLQRGGKLENRKRVSVSEFTDVELLTAMDLSDRVGDVAACSGYREWRPPNAKDHRLYFMIYRSRRLWKVWFSPSLRQVITRWSSGHVGNVWTSVWFLKPCYTRRTDGLSRRPNLTAHQSYKGWPIGCQVGPSMLPVSQLQRRWSYQWRVTGTTGGWRMSVMGRTNSSRATRTGRPDCSLLF